MHRVLLKVALAVASVAVPLTAAAPPAHADQPAAEAQFLAKINGLRASKGLSRLALSSPVTAVAEGWTQHMAATGSLAHNPQLSSLPGKWTVAGENVGLGPDVDTLFNAFVASPHHYENLVDPRYNTVGISVVIAANGTMWTTHDFEALPTATPAATSPAAVAPKPAPTSAPKPAAKPTPLAAPKPAVAAAPVPSAAPAPAPAVARPPVAPARVKLSLAQLRGADPTL